MATAQTKAQTHSIRVSVISRSQCPRQVKSFSVPSEVHVTRTRRSHSFVKNYVAPHHSLTEKSTKTNPPRHTTDSERDPLRLTLHIPQSNSIRSSQAQEQRTTDGAKMININANLTRNRRLSGRFKEGQENEHSDSIARNSTPTISTTSKHSTFDGLTNKKNRRLQPMQSTPRNSIGLEKEKTKRRRRKFGRYGCWWCSPCCAVGSVLISVLLLGALAALLISLLGMKKQSTVMTNEVNTIDYTNISTTTETTTSTTTTFFTSAQGCLNQSWIDTSSSLAWWPFDGSYNDQTGIYNGYPSGDLPIFDTGYIGQAVLFNASVPQRILAPFIPLDNVSFTVTAWIKPTAYPNPSDHGIVGLCPANIRDMCLHIVIRFQRLYFGFFADDIRGNTTIGLDQWIHTAFVFDSSTRKQTIYLNGMEDGQRTAAGALNTTSGNLTMGFSERVRTPNNSYHGYIDELSIHQRPMSSCEVLERATLAAHFRFDTLLSYNDSGPNAVPSTYSSTSIVSGHRNQAISFAGASSSYFQASGLTSLGISDYAFSITFWLQPQTLSGTLVHLSSSATGTGSTCFPLLGFAASGAIVAQVLTTAGTVVTATGPILPVSSSWIPVVQTWSVANGLRLYVNSTLVSSVAASTFLGSGTTPNYATLGGCLSGCGGACTNGLVGAPGFFTGAIDDWRIYSRELSPSDVYTLYLST